MKYPKRKGKRLENKVAEIIRELWNIKEKDKVHRALTSGNISFERGDIKFNLNKNIHLWIECKNREDWSESNLIKFNNSIKKYFKKVIQDINKKQEIFFPVLIINKAFLPRSYLITIYDLVINETFLIKCNLYLDKEVFEDSNFIMLVKINKNEIMDNNNILEKHISKNSSKLTLLITYTDNFFKFIKPLF